MRALAASERITVARSLGSDVVKLADEICRSFQKDGTAPGWLLREFLQALHDRAGEAMGSNIGIALQMAVLGKIQGVTNGNDDADARRRKPYGGFTGRRE